MGAKCICCGPNFPTFFDETGDEERSRETTVENSVAEEFATDAYFEIEIAIAGLRFEHFGFNTYIQPCTNN